jgi:hypothetical protein
MSKFSGIPARKPVPEPKKAKHRKKGHGKPKGC